jgi:glucosamine--fructose-6-phosphate aminotransferase (isomerizing)
MLAEIRQQPSALENTLREELKNFERLKQRITDKPPRFIVLAARGTSDNAAQFARYLIEITTGIPVSLSAPSVFTLYRAAMRLEDVLVVAISQSGESTDTNYVLDRAREAGAPTIGITNEANSTLAKLADHAFLVRAGREKSVAATKTYTGQMLAAYLLAWALGAPIEVDELRRLPSLVESALKLERTISEIAGRYTFMTRCVVLGRGLNYSNAFEFALKLMETCYVVAERFSSADLMHGPIAMVERAFPVFVFGAPGVTWPGLRDIITQVKNLRAETIMVTDKSNREANGLAQRAIVIPERLAHKGKLPEEVYTPIPYIVPAQLFAAFLAAEKGLDPDKPRTLSKVTQTL